MTFLQFVKSVFFNPLPRLNILRTIFFNFKVLPFDQAMHLPIHLYGNWNFRVLKGRVVIPTSQVKFGSYRFGFDYASYFTVRMNSLSLHEDSIFELGEAVRIGQGVQICLYPGAKLTMNNFSHLGDRVILIDYHSITIGVKSAVTWNCQVTDFNSHYVVDAKNNKIANICKPVVIGDYCWICNRTVIMPGTKLPSRTIVASNSLLNRDYIANGVPERSLIGGIPAKLIRTDLYRIYNRDNENWLKQYFNQNRDTTYYDIKESSQFEE